MMDVVNYCGISGGKDSAATALWLIHESGLDPATFRFAFCDTGNEHQLTYDHIQYLSDTFEAMGAPRIVTLNPDLSFYDLARKKGRFPSTKARFCTQYLKVIPTRKDIERLHADGLEVVLFSGTRAAESHARAQLPESGFDDGFGCYVRRPLLRWSLDDVMQYHKRFDVRLNPLYELGATRVGCFPCIMSNKQEIRLIAAQFPERIDELEIAENSFNSERGFSSFFRRNHVPLRHRSKTIIDKKGRAVRVPTIRDVVEWSQTVERARFRGPRLFDYEPDHGLVCDSGRGLCE